MTRTHFEYATPAMRDPDTDEQADTEGGGAQGTDSA